MELKAYFASAGDAGYSDIEGRYYHPKQWSSDMGVIGSGGDYYLVWSTKGVHYVMSHYPGRRSDALEKFEKMMNHSNFDNARKALKEKIDGFRNK